MKPELLRFNTVFRETLERDFHIHTDITDGTSSLEEYIEKALELRLHEIAFTEHVRRTSPWYLSFVERVERLREFYKNKIRIYHGIETKILNTEGELDATDEMLDTAELILGSVHRFPETCLPGSSSVAMLSLDEFATIEYRLSRAIIKDSRADVLAHPGGMFIRKFTTPFPREYLGVLIDLANKYNTAIEINSSYLKDITFDQDMFSRSNPVVSLGSDAHDKKDLGTVIHYIKTIQQRC